MNNGLSVVLACFEKRGKNKIKRGGGKSLLCVCKCVRAQMCSFCAPRLIFLPDDAVSGEARRDSRARV